MKKSSSSSQSFIKRPVPRKVAVSTEVASSVAKQQTVSRASSVTSKTKSSRRNKSSLGLSASQVRELEKRLHSMQQEIKDALFGKATSVTTHAMNESLIKGDDAEVAEKQRMSNAALQELDFLKSRLRLVQRALAKVNAGVYGLCEETEEPIGFERLAVVPWARYSVHVQELRERKMRDFKINRLRSEA